MLFFRDENYGKSLLHFITAKRHPQIAVRLITDQEELIGCSNEQMVVLTDREEVQELSLPIKIFLCDRQSRNNLCIYQYQKAEAVYQELLWHLKLPTVERETDLIRGVYVVFGTEGGQQLLARSFAKMLAGQQKCLWIDLSRFSEMPAIPEESLLEELLLTESAPQVLDKIQKIRHEKEGYHFLPPMKYFGDIVDCTCNEWWSVLECLQAKGDFPCIIISTDFLLESMIQLMKNADGAFIVHPEGKEKQFDRFISYCHMGNISITGKEVQPAAIPEEHAKKAELPEFFVEEVWGKGCQCFESKRGITESDLTGNSTWGTDQ